MSAFEPGTFVFVPHAEEQYVAAKVLTAFKPGDAADVELLDGTLHSVSASESKEASAVDEDSLGSFEDMIKLNNLNEPLILHNLRERFKKHKIYTNVTGGILIAVNPFQLLPLYTPEVQDKYKDVASLSSQPPHVYATACSAYNAMMSEQRDQAIIISGESGAGKTECLKISLQFLAEVSSRTGKTAKTVAAADKQESLEQQILQSNPVMEAFGNAKTTRNNNSSRFGKWTEVVFNGAGAIVGGSIINYLLEKSRIPFQADQERNYHVFYQLLAGGEMDAAFKSELKLQDAEEYHYMNQSGVTTVETINDEQDWIDMTNAMDVLAWPADIKAATWRLLTGMLNLGNVTFEVDPSGADENSARVANPAQLQAAAGFLGVDAAALQECLCYAKLKIAGSVTLKQYSLDDARNARDATSKAMYGSMFDDIIERINQTLGGVRIKAEAAAKRERLQTLGVLDIFGFESFETNSFEQLCINYCNEKLQFHFNEHIFRMEQEEYKREGIDVSAITFADNKPTLDLLEAKGTGVFAMIDEEINVPRGSDEGFLSKVLQKHGKHDNMKRPKPRDKDADKVFVIVHYAGSVPYNCSSFLDKNKDALHDDIIEVLSASTVPFIKSLAPQPAASGAGGRKKGKATLGHQFKASLNALMDTLNACQPHFIRCMKPNSVKKGGIFDSEMMLAQLRYAGLLEVCRIRQVGYPVRREFDDFVFRYRPLATKPVADHTSLLADMKEQGLITDGEWQVGHTKVFMRNAQQQALEEQREVALHSVVTRIQKVVRKFVVRCNVARWQGILANLKAATAARDEDALDAAMLDLGELPYGGKHLEAVKAAITLRERLDEEHRVEKLLDDAIAEREESSLRAAVKAAAAMSPPFTPPQVAKATELIAVIEKERAAQAALRAAVEKRDREGLASAIAAADALGEFVTASDAYKQAAALMKRLNEEEAARAAVRAAMGSKDVSALAEALDKMIGMGMDSDPIVAEGQAVKAAMEQQYAALEGVKDAVKARKLAAVTSALGAAAKAGVDSGVPVMVEAKALQQRLQAEEAVEAKLAAATEGSDLAAVQAALAEAKGMSPPYAETLPDSKVYAAAEKQAAKLEAWAKAKQALSAAVASGTVEALDDALKAANDAGLPDCAERAAASDAMGKLGAEAAALSALSSALSSGSRAAVEEALAKLQEVDGDHSKAVDNANATLAKWHEQDRVAEEVSQIMNVSGTVNLGALRDAVAKAEELGADARHEVIAEARAKLAESDKDTKFMEAIDAARAAHDEEGIDKAVADAAAAGASGAVAAHGAKAKELLGQESALSDELSTALEAKDMDSLRSLLARAAELSISNTKVRDAKLLVDTADKKGGILQGLADATSAADEEKLNSFLQQAIELGLEGPEVEAAQAMAEQLAKDAELAGELRAEMKDLTNKISGREDVVPDDVTRLHAARDAAVEKGVSSGSPYMAAAEELSSRLENILIVQGEMAAAIGAGALRDLKKAVDRAEELGLEEAPSLRKARAAVRELERERARQVAEDDDMLEDDDVPALDDDEVKRARDEKMRKASEERFHFAKFSRVRNDEDFAKGIMLQKAKAKRLKLRWQSTPLHKSLLDFTSKDLSKQAARLHRNLLGYCGDKSMSFPATLAQDILQKGIDTPELVDEIYLQLCKHLTNNPRPESMLRAWQVMCMAVGTFPPTRDFENYLLNFILAHQEAGGAIGNFAQYSLRRLEGMMNSGPSGYVPTVEDITAYAERPPILATIELVDGTPLTEQLPITPDLNVAKVLDICTHFMELQDPRMQYFGIFVEDVDTDGAGYNPLTAKGVCEALPKTPRPLQNENFMGDIVMMKLRHNQAYKFVFKRKIYLRSQDEPSEDPMFARLVYLQAVDEVIKGNIPLDDEEEVAKLVAEFMAVEFGEEMPDNVDDLVDDSNGQLEEWLPVPWRPRLDLYEWADKVLAYREEAATRDPDELQMEIVEQVKDHPLYGTCFFHVRKNKFPPAMASLPDRLILAFNSEGAHFLDESYDTLASFGYADIYRWGGSSTALSIIAWDPHNNDTQEINMWTSQAADCAACILDHINALLAQM